MDAWRDVEVAAAEALDGPTQQDLEAIRAATFTVEAVQEREKVTDHDVAAFVDVLAAERRPGRALDPLRADLLRRARHRARAAAAPRGRADPRRRPRLRRRARRAGARARATRCASAAPTASTPSRRASGSSSRASRSRPTATPSGWSAPSRRSPRARSPAPSAPTRRSARTSRRACSSGLGLHGEPVSTQVVPRDRHAELLSAIALAGAGLERFATEIRHLQRTEVREVEEPFRAGQKGSSAMPHKRNPITTERITGLARVLRGYAQTGLENVALWHERDISHSGAERVVLPDATILLDYMQHLALRVARGMTVHDRPHAREPRDHERRAVLPAGAARARGVRDAARRRLPDRPAPRPAGLGHAHAAARAARGRGGRRARPRRGLRLRALHPPRPASAADDWRSIPTMPDADRHPRRSRDEHRPLPRDPGRDRGPVHLHRDRRPPRRPRSACSTPTRSSRSASRSSTSTRSAATSCRRRG